MSKLADVLNTNLAIPAAIEGKFTFLPKLSTQMAKVAGQVPAGPDIPAMAVTILEPPPPNKTGQPLASFFAAATPTTTGQRLPLSPPTPGAIRATVTYESLQLSPKNPGAQRGTVMYE